MGLAFYYISMCQNIDLEVTHLNISEKISNQSQQMENTRSLWKKLTEPEKNCYNMK